MVEAVEKRKHREEEGLGAGALRGRVKGESLSGAEASEQRLTW